MKLAIVHDYLMQAGGAERVVEAMHEIWPEAPVFTSVYDPSGTFPSFKNMDVRTSFLQRFKVARQAKTHKLMLPFFPAAFEHLDMRGFEVVISSSSSFAKGVVTEPETCHICYCHTPARFAWRYHEYVSQGNFGKSQRRVLPFLVHYLRSWELAAANRVDYFVANSHYVARRIRKYYGRECDVIYPPIETSRFVVEPNPTEDYLLIVSRMIAYKRVDLAIEACNRLGIKLKVVGGGPDLAKMKAMAGPTVEVLGRIPDGQIEKLFAHCRAFLFPGEEDFGIVPVEAMACGRPVIAYRSGGAMETVVDGKTGLFFNEPTVESLMDAITRLDGLHIDPQAIRAHAEKFDTKAFQTKLSALVQAKCEEHRQRYGAFRPETELTRALEVDNPLIAATVPVGAETVVLPTGPVTRGANGASGDAPENA